MIHQWKAQPADPTPSYVRWANISGVSAAVLLALFVFYFVLYVLDLLPTPTIGVTPVWTSLIALLAAVKIVQVVVDRSLQNLASLVETRFADINDRLDEVSKASLTAAEETGRWKGVAATLREVQQGDSGEVISINGGGRRRQS